MTVLIIFTIAWAFIIVIWFIAAYLLIKMYSVSWKEALSLLGTEVELWHYSRGPFRVIGRCSTGAGITAQGPQGSFRIPKRDFDRGLVAWGDPHA